MSANSKILKPAGLTADDLELQVAQAMFDLECNVADMKKDMRPVQFTAAKEVPSVADNSD